MTFLKRFPCALALCLFALTAGARAQSPAIEVASDGRRVEFSSDGRLADMRIEVFAPSGELVFDSGAVMGQSIEWKMQDAAGKRVADGLYLATITVTDSAGKRRKRIEQLTVSSEAVSGPTPTVFGPINGEGTSGKIAKFTGANAIGDSVITESASGRVGVGTTAAPSSLLQVNGAQPAAVAVSGTAATMLLQTSGGKGGNTTGSAKSGGTGASIALVAGNGGDAPLTSKNGTGGSITLQPGSTGGGAGTAGPSGNVLLAPNGVGNVGVGTNAPKSKLTVTGGDIQIATAGKGIVFPDTSLQTTAALPAVQHNATLTGTGTAASPLGINPGGVTSSHLADDSVGVSELNTAAAPTAGQVLTYSGGNLTWLTPSGGGGGGSVIAFRHTRTTATNCGPTGLTTEFSPLNHASINGNPNALIFITAIIGITPANNDANQNYFVVYTGSTAFGTCPANRWLIRGGDVDPSDGNGSLFNVLIVP